MFCCVMIIIIISKKQDKQRGPKHYNTSANNTNIHFLCTTSQMDTSKLTPKQIESLFLSLQTKVIPLGQGPKYDKICRYAENVPREERNIVDVQDIFMAMR